MRLVTKERILSVLVFMAIIPVVFSGILVCRKCGYESPEGSEICSHCKAKLPASQLKPQAEAAPGDNMLASGKLKWIDSKVIEDELNLALRYLDAGDFDLANLYAKNASALEILANPAVKEGRSDKIVEIRRKSETGGMSAGRKCHLCGGTGKFVLETTGLNNKTTKISVADKVCQQCNGTGKVLKPTTMDERRFKLGRAKNRFIELQQGRKFVPMGGAWVPAEFEGKFSVKQAVQVKRAVAAPCSECMGLGRMDCTKCKGLGEVKCTYSGCVNGKVEIEDEGKIVKGKDKKIVNCKMCNGNGFVPCLDCRGQGNLVCKKCSGSGERAVCVRCGGQGTIACRRCQGAGTVKDAPCQECRGDGVVECTACSGDGRKR